MLKRVSTMFSVKKKVSTMFKAGEQTRRANLNNNFRICEL